MRARFPGGAGRRRGRGRGLTVRLVLAVASLAGPAVAHTTLPAADDNMFTLGPSLAAAPGSGPRSGFLLGADATLTIALGWVSVGARALPGEEWNLYPYAEAGVWFGLNLGAGYSLGVGGGAPLQNWHLFVGLPVPVGALGDEPLFFVEPYYRPTMSLNDPKDSPALHEIGLLVKWAWEVGSSHD